jgi:hypothetical protein
MCVLNENNWNVHMNWTMWCVEANRQYFLDHTGNILLSKPERGVK